MIGGIPIQTQGESRLIKKELLEAVLSLQFGPVLYKSITRELEELIIEPLSSNGHLHSTSLSALFWLSGFMSHNNNTNSNRLCDSLC